MLRIVKILSFLCVAYLYCTYIFVLTPNSQKPCIILYKNKVFFFGKLLFDMPTQFIKSKPPRKFVQENELTSSI